MGSVPKDHFQGRRQRGTVNQHHTSPTTQFRILAFLFHHVHIISCTSAIVKHFVGVAEKQHSTERIKLLVQNCNYLFQLNALDLSAANTQQSIKAVIQTFNCTLQIFFCSGNVHCVTVFADLGVDHEFHCSLFRFFLSMESLSHRVAKLSRPVVFTQQLQMHPNK